MTEVRELIDAVVSCGAAIHLDGNRLLLTPASKIPAELKTRLRERKLELLSYLSRKPADFVELEASMRRLEAENIWLAVNEDGDLRIVRSEAVAHQAAMDGFTIYTPKDAYMYVTLTERERRMLRNFKRTFNASIESGESK